jgi:CubicO group peptidase (beta-lactamase class C family)
MVQIDRRVALGGLFAAAWPAHGLARPALAPPDEGPLSVKAVEDLLAQHKVPGASLAIIHDGTLVATYCYGVAQGQRPVRTTTRFQAASISKTINALAILRLAALSRLDLDDPVNKHLVTWKLPDNVFTETRAVTLRMLLSHSGGTTVTVFEGYMPGRPLPGLVQILDGRPPATNDPVRVAWPPGHAFRYSGGGITVLQQLVADVTRDSYPAAIARLVLGPLGMTHSNYVQQPDALGRAQLALAHDDDGEPHSVGFRIHPELAAAGLWTTPGDLARAVLAIIRSWHGVAGAFLPQSLAQAMLTPVVEDAGLGVFFAGNSLFTHVGANIGYRALFIADAAAERATIMMTNGDNGDPVCAEINRRVAEDLRWA